MDLSGVIFVVLAVVWAVYLIPKALKQGDEVARTRSIERFSADTRVVARREPVSDRDARLVVSAALPAAAQTLTPAPATASAPATVTAPVEVEPRGSVVEPVLARGRSAVRRTASRVAARRRRRILGCLLLLDVAIAVVAYLGYVPLWSVAAPAGLTVIFLFLCRTQRRRERARAVALHHAGSPPADAGAEQEVSVRGSGAGAPQAARVDAEQAMPDVPLDRSPGHLGALSSAAPDSEVLAPQPTAQHGAVAPTADGGTIWDPLPVTLPTYVTKPKARRTVRTIDLQEPGTWTSGRTAEDTELAARAVETAATEGAEATSGQRAVGT